MTRLWLGLTLSATLVTAAALGDDKATCLDAVSRGQTLRASHKLVEAREQLRVCAAARCPAVIQTDCASWLAEVDKALPGVVLAARNGEGADLVDVKVSVDGQALVSSLDGQAVPMNAGPHTFHFEAADGTTADRQVVILEGDKTQNIAVVLGKRPTASTTATAAAAAAPDPWPTAGWVAGALGVVGLGVGTAFGVKAISDKNGAHCDASDACDAGPLGDANSAATISTIGIVAGGALLAGGTALVLFAGNKKEGAASTRASVKAVPLLGTRGGGLWLEGTW